MTVRAYVAVLRIELHFPESASLKARRRELAPVKAHLQTRLRATVAEVGHLDVWQRATLVAALAGGSARHLDGLVDGLEAWLDARFPAGAVVERRVVSWADLDA